MSLSIYELQRLENIQKNNYRLASLGFEKLKDPEEETRPKKPRQPRQYEQRAPNPRRNCRKDDVNKPKEEEEYKWYDYDYSVPDNTLQPVVDGESGEEDGNGDDYDYSRDYDSESGSEYQYDGLSEDDYERKERKYMQDMNYYKRTGKTKGVIRKKPVHKKKSKKQKENVKKMSRKHRSNDDKDVDLGRRKLGDLEDRYAHVWKGMHGDMPVAEMDVAMKNAFRGLIEHHFISADLAGYHGSNPTSLKKAKKIATLLFGRCDSGGCFLTVNSMLESGARKRAVEYATSVNTSKLPVKKVITNEVGCFEEMVDFVKKGLFEKFNAALVSAVHEQGESASSEGEGEGEGEGDAAASVDGVSETEGGENSASQEPQVIETSMMHASSFDYADFENGVEEKEFDYWDESEVDYTVDVDLETNYPEEDAMEVEANKVF